MQLQPVKTHSTPWDPATVKVTLNITLDGCIVPTTAGGARVDYSHLVVLDNFLDEPTRQGLMEALTQPGWQGAAPPEAQWERATADAAERPVTWGLRSQVLSQLCAADLPAKLEVQSRLCKLYPDMLIAHMPSQQIQLGLQQQQEEQQQQPPADQQQHHQEQQQQPQQQPQEPEQQQQQRQAASGPVGVDCSWLLANAAVCGDQFSWHVDADPQTFPEHTTWTQQYGQYCNREPGKPLFVSLLVYLDKEWPREYDAETLFLDSGTDTGVFVRPKAYRVVLMDQDVAHRLSTPSAAANRPRYSLVWKLVMTPKAQAYSQQGQQQQGQGQQVQRERSHGKKVQAEAAACIARKEWGPPVYFGSAAHVLRVARQTAAAAAAGAGPAAAQPKAAAGKDPLATGASRVHEEDRDDGADVGDDDTQATKKQRVQ